MAQDPFGKLRRDAGAELPRAAASLPEAQQPEGVAVKAHENPLLTDRRGRDVWQWRLSVHCEDLHAAFAASNASAN